MNSRKSRVVNLVLIGTLAATLTACSDPQYVSNEQKQVQQNSYKSQKDCEDHWGKAGQTGNDNTCKPVHSSSGGGAFVYMGPRYYWDHNAGHAMVANPDGSVKPAPVTASGAIASNPVRSSGGSVARSSFTTTTSTATVATVSRGGFGGSVSGGSSSGG